MKSFIRITLSTLLVGLFFAANAQNDAISSYFDQYVEDDNFTVVYISPKMFNMITKLDLNELKDIKNEPETQMALDIISNLKGLRVLTTEKNPSKFYEEAIAKIPTQSYDLLMSVRDKGENVRIFTKDDGGSIIHELLLLVGGGSEFVMLSLTGVIDLEKVGHLAKIMDIKGAEHLDKVKDK